MYDYFDIVINGLHSFGSWVAGWPPTLIGVLIGSFFTLLGVVLTTRSNLRSLRLQLEHDRQQKRIQRILTTRRDVYLEVAEAIASGMNSLIHLSDITRDAVAILANYNEKCDHIAKIHIIATETTALRFVEFMNHLGKALMGIHILRAPLLRTHLDMLDLLEQIKRSRTSLEHNVELMKQFNIDGTMDSRRMDQLQKNFDFDRDLGTKAKSEYDNLLEMLRPKQLALFEHCQQEHRLLSHKILPLLESVRLELDNPISVEEYEKVYTAASGIDHEKLKVLFGIKNDDPSQAPTDDVIISTPS